MRIFYFVTAVLCFSISLRAQLTIGVGYELDGFDTEGMNTFVSSYNDYFGSSATQPLKALGSFDLKGLQYSLGYRFLKPQWTFATTVTYGKSNHSFNSRVAGNFGQEHHLQFRDLNFIFSGGPVLAKNILLEGIFNIGFRNTTLDVLTVFPDGSRSQDYVFDINGVYTTFTPCYEAGLGLGFRLGHFILSGRITKAFNFPGSNLGSEGTELTDFDVNRYRSNSFPRDFGIWLNDSFGADQENVIYSDEFRGIRIGLSIEYIFIKNKSENQ